MATKRETVLARARADRRRYRRIDVELDGRLFLPQEQRETIVRVHDLSAGGARIACTEDLESGVTVILYVGDFGRFEGVVVRLSGGDFGVQFQCSALKRERIVEQLMVFLNRERVDEAMLRRHDRAPSRGVARFTRNTGQSIECEVLDLSLSGVSLITDIRPPVGEIVLIGQMAGRVARHHEQGIAIEFVTPLPAAAPGDSATRPDRRSGGQ